MQFYECLINIFVHSTFSGKEACKVRVALTSFFDSLTLVTESMEKFGPPAPSYDYH